MRSVVAVSVSARRAAGHRSHRPSLMLCDWSARVWTNNDIAARLFISPRTVHTHLTHINTKLNLTSRVQLVQKAAKHR
jgi:hypothetical protein